ncbi:hypothetical protein L9F63_017187, partial [Diploptera punctata]
SSMADFPGYQQEGPRSKSKKTRGSHIQSQGEEESSSRYGPIGPFRSPVHYMLQVQAVFPTTF